MSQTGVITRRFPFGLRWLGAALWRLEHAFEQPIPPEVYDRLEKELGGEADG